MRPAKHNMARTPEYIAWIAMKQRCFYPKFIGWKDYGGRGITVSDRWVNSFENFYSDVGPRPAKGYSIDRFPNANGNYEPGNVRWATRKEQGLNRRTCHQLEFRGEKLSITEWSEKTGIPRNAIYLRINHMGWSIERSLTTPTRRPKK